MSPFLFFFASAIFAHGLWDHDRASRAKRHKPPNVNVIDEILVGMSEDEFSTID